MSITEGRAGTEGRAATDGRAAAEPPSPAAAGTGARLARADGVELLGPVHGSGYRDGVALVRRSDGQMVQLGPLMYGLLEEADGRRSATELATALSERLGRRMGEAHVRRLAEKLAAQGLLAGSETNAPPRRSPLLALRWKYLITNPLLTRRLSSPFAFLFRPWIVWPVTAAFAFVCWFVLVRKGVASATAQAFHSPALLLLVFVLAVVSAGFHEMGHAAACRYGGATPGGMGVGLYLVWPAFYTDVTDAYRLPRRDRLRVDLGGLYFNEVVAVLTMLVWVFWRVDALLLVVALQILQMVKQLSPVIRADGYHILSDATGVPDLYSHMGPTIRRLLPGRSREPAALTGRARLLVSVWVLIMVPVLISLMLGAVLLLPKMMTSAWDSGRVIIHGLPHQIADFQVVNLFAALLRLVALVLPVAGSGLVAQKMVRSYWGRARAWSAGRPRRQGVVTLATAGIIALLAWAWWPSGQYQPVRANQNGTIQGLVHLISTPGHAVRPGPSATEIAPGTHLALAMIPTGGATRTHPALFVFPGARGKPASAVLSFGPGSLSAAFPFVLPGKPGPGGTQALAIGTHDGGVTYQVAYALVTVTGGNPVTQTNSAFALADCRACTTVAVSFQLVLVVGQSGKIAPINAAGALNYQCPACSTTALADQMIITLTAQPSPALLAELQASLTKLNALQALGSSGTPNAVAAQVGAVQQEIQNELAGSGLLAGPVSTSTTVAGTSTGPDTTPSSTAMTTPVSTDNPTASEPTASTPPGTDTSATTTSTTTIPADSSTSTPTSTAATATSASSP